MATAAFSPLAACRGDYEQRPGQRECEQHGAFVGREFLGADGEVIGFMPMTCPACAEIERERREREAQALAAAERIANALAASGIPRRHAGCTLEGFTPTPSTQAAYDAVVSYAQRWPAQLKTGESLILIGDIGTGKTHLGCALLRAVIEAGGKGRYTTVQGLLRNVRSTWGNRNAERSEASVIAEYATTQLLVLDEVGTSNGGSNELVILFDILDQRYQDMLPTVVMGNLSTAELEQALDARAVDRLRDGGGKAYRLQGPSQRRRTAA